MVAIEQKATLLAAAGAGGHERRAFVLSEAVELFLKVALVEQTLGEAVD